MVHGDLSDPTALREGCAGTDVVFHLAGRISARDLRDFMTSTGTVPPSCWRRRLPNRSPASCTCRPSRPGARPSRADRSTSPGPRPRSRIMGAASWPARSWCAPPPPWTIVRAPVVYGEWDREVLKLFKVARTGVAPVFGDGSQELSVVYAGIWPGADRGGDHPGGARKVYYAATR